MANKLFDNYQLANISLNNKVVMAPMTRSRAINNVPNDLMATYYTQRASAGLIITEGTSPSPNGLGYARIPGIYSNEQIEGWKKVTDEVHEKGGKIFIQLMHTGRVSHEINLPDGAKVVGSSNIVAAGEMWTDANGLQPHTVPHVLTTEEVKLTIEEYVQASKNAIKAGFDGVELHGANGYLIEQFINGGINNRTDEYGGSVKNRSRFLLEIAEQAAAAIGKDKLSVRISPFSTFNDIPAYNEVDETYKYIAQKLNDLDIAYLHYLDHSPSGLELVSQDLRNALRATFKNTIIFCGALTKESASAIIESGQVDLAAFGKPFVSNPDLVKRFAIDAELALPNFDLLYTSGSEGYTDYPSLSK